MGLDTIQYRRWEKLAQGQLDSFRIGQRHNLDVFQQVGFPVRADSIESIGALLDTMQEGRFDAYMKDLGGLSESERELFVDAAIDLLRFQRTYLPYRDPILPLDALIAAFSIYLKVRRLHPDFSSVLEFGPGCGYLALFLQRLEGLENYTQVEACESFFLLQNKVNQFLFADSAYAHLPIVSGLGYQSYYPDLPGEFQAEGKRPPDRVTFETPRQCEQYPWWNLEQLRQQAGPFDVVTSNANLMEFSTAALYDYLALIKEKLSDEGIFFVQCFGYGGGVGRTIESLWDALYAFRLAPLFIVSDQTVDISQLLQEIAPEVERLVVMPAGFTARQIVADQRLRDRFRSVVLVDRNKQGDHCGVPIISPDALEGTAADLALIVHKDREIVESYRHLCQEAGITVMDLEGGASMRSFAVPYGLFVGDRHPDFTVCYRRERYETGGGGELSSELPITETFFPSTTGRQHYRREDIARLLSGRIATRSR